MQSATFLLRQVMPICAAFLIAPTHMAQAGIIPGNGSYLTAVAAGSFGFVADGTSNTIQLTDATRLTVCFDHVAFGAPRSGITDGTSNTLVFGESTTLTVQPGRVLPRQSITDIADGTSNTIQFGETPPDALCFGDTRIGDPAGGITDGTSNTIQFGETSRFDVCFSAVRIGQIADGTSNTIQFGEVSSSPVCFEDVQVAIDASLAVPEPAMALIWSLCLAGMLAFHRRGQSERKPPRERS